MILVNGISQTQIAISDRGFQYGDGLFETIEVIGGQPVFWQQHLQRLHLGCQRLAIPMPDAAVLIQEALQLCDDCPRGVLKIIITRGSGGRGYRQPPEIQPSRVLSLHPFPDYSPAFYTEGVTVRFCQNRLGRNPALAGIKHLNRLEQILARSEWQDDYQEGIMLDSEGLVVEGTMSNLFLVKQQTLFTPQLNQCGVAGVMRAVVIELAAQLGMKVNECTVLPEDLMQVDELFMTNAIIGIWPVAQLAQREFVVGDVVRQLQAALVRYKKADTHHWQNS